MATEGMKSGKPERSPAQDHLPAVSGGAAAREAKRAGKKPAAAASSAGSAPSSAATVTVPSDVGRRSVPGAGELPGWKLDSLCRDSGITAAVMSGGFPCV